MNWASPRRILGEIEDMAQLLGTSRATPRGLLRVNATLGFGRSHVAPLISRFIRKHPQVEVQLQLTVTPSPLTDDAYGVWRLSSGRGKSASTEVIKTRGNLSTSDGEIAVNWALDGHGILMRAQWDIERHLKSGRLVQVLAQFHTPDADIHAVYPQRHPLAARVRAFVDFLAMSFHRRVASSTP